MKKLEAYELLEEKELKDLNSVGYRLRHKKTGAKIALIQNDDENKVFYIGFRTPPEDSTGVAHIVEHTVLCGSEKFPVKDPFVELAKGSLNTFLNAMTYPDKTVYPIASCNDKDFQNLMDVYLDAVFHPNIYKYEEIFQQEGWHYEMEDENSPITLNGVVYNEMKGAFSSPESVLERSILNSLFPDTTYRNESGGDPLCIPDLTYEDYLDFHRRYYHPSNSYIYLYGDMDMEEKLDWIDREYLSKYEAITLDSAIKKQEPFSKPLEITFSYPVASNEPLEDNTYLSYNTVVGEVLDKELYLAFEILDYALLSAPGAPLKQALLDAGIGKDIMSSFDNGIYQPIFSIIAKNANEVQKEEFVAIIHKVLEDAVKNGINKKSLLAGINSAEFRFREADFGSYPKGLMYGLQCLDSWIYDETQPFMHIEAIETYGFLKSQVDTGYFEKLVQTYLLDNNHVSVVITKPERGLNAKTEKELEEKLEAYRETLSEEERRNIAAQTKHLKEYQDEPSSKEDLEKIPLLRREDLGKKAAELQNEELAIEGTPVLYHNLFTNGIQYVDYLFDLKHIPQEELPYVGLLKAILGYVDTEHYDYGDLSNEINLNTGGINCGILITADVQDVDSYNLKFELRTKFLAEKAATTMFLVKEIICGSDFSDGKRLHEILSECKSKLQMMFAGAGHTASALRAMSYFSKTAQINDLTSGIAFYRVVADYEEHFEEKEEELRAHLQKLMGEIFRKENLMVSVTAKEEGLETVKQELAGLKEALYETPVETTEQEISCEKKNEGFLAASKVQYVSRAGNFRKEGYDYTGALRILKVIMGYDYLWMNIRVKGGAYGCMSAYGKNGDTFFTSYRDPNLSATNEVYNHIPEYLENFSVDERDMTKYIIGTISDMDTPLTPCMKGRRSLISYLGHITEGDLQKEREEVLTATPQDIRDLAPMISAVLGEENLCVIGNEEKLKAEKEMFTEVKNLY